MCMKTCIIWKCKIVKGMKNLHNFAQDLVPTCRTSKQHFRNGNISIIRLEYFNEFETQGFTEYDACCRRVCVPGQNMTTTKKGSE